MSALSHYLVRVKKNKDALDGFIILRTEDSVHNNEQVAFDPEGPKVPSRGLCAYVVRSL